MKKLITFADNNYHQRVWAVAWRMRNENERTICLTLFTSILTAPYALHTQYWRTAHRLMV